MPDVISHYQIVRKLGRGGMGEVYLAKDSKLHRLVALKVIVPESAGDANRAKRFTREAHAVSSLNHPNIAVIHEIGEAEDSTPFIAMEYIEGQTIAEKIGAGPLDIAQIVDLATQIADALDEAHSKGVVHRDLKPSNVMITPRGHAKVLDFGLAKLTTIGPESATDLKSDPGLVVGTVNYMSPEQALGREVDTRTDLFSFGVLLYEMTTARPAFAGASSTEIIERIVHAEPEAIARFNYSAPAELERIIRKCLQKDRESRYQSARDVVVDLKNLKRSSDSHPVVTSPPRSRGRWIAIAAIPIVVLVVAALWKFWPRKTAAAGERPMTSIAVLPFSSLEAAAVPRLGFGLPDEVVTILSYNPGVAVRPFATTRRLADSDPAQVGRSLNVDKVITGHYSTDGGELDVTLEAIDVGTNRVVWRNSINANELMSLRKALSM